jgi:ABC-type lipoprotein release transport system permease subunit
LALILAACGLLGGEALKALIVSVEPRDPVIVAGVVTVLVATGALAGLIPALRASQCDPVEALKSEG